MAHPVFNRSMTLLAFLAAGAISGCSAGPAGTTPSASGDESPGQDAARRGTDSTEAARPELLGEVVTEGGVKYSFFASSLGEVDLSIEAPSGSDSLPTLPTADTNFVQFYEQIAHQPAPSALVDAVALADTLRDQTSTPGAQAAPQYDRGSVVPSAQDQGGVSSQEQSLTSSQFTSMYCPNGYDFLFCWPNTTGNPWVQLTSTYLAGAVSAIDCRIHYRYRYYDDGWKTFRDLYADPGSHWWWYMSGGSISRRFEVVGNTSTCHLHFSVWGDY
jgi:hypothetical protein